MSYRGAASSNLTDNSPIFSLYFSTDTLLFHQKHKKVWPAAQRDTVAVTHIRSIPPEARRNNNNNNKRAPAHGNGSQKSHYMEEEDEEEEVIENCISRDSLIIWDWIRKGKMECWEETLSRWYLEYNNVTTYVLCVIRFVLFVCFFVSIGVVC